MNMIKWQKLFMFSIRFSISVSRPFPISWLLSVLASRFQFSLAPEPSQRLHKFQREVWALILEKLFINSITVTQWPAATTARNRLELIIIIIRTRNHWNIMLYAYISRLIRIIHSSFRITIPCFIRNWAYTYTLT